MQQLKYSVAAGNATATVALKQSAGTTPATVLGNTTATVLGDDNSYSTR